MDIQTILTGIQKHRDLIYQERQWNDPGALSDSMTKIANYNAYLADHLAPLHKEATDAAHAVYLESSKTTSTTAAQQLARGETTGEREAYEQAMFIYKATDKLISVLQSRLKVIENQIKKANIT